jgi:endonuclease YncB( thermonuclease family)
MPAIASYQIPHLLGVVDYSKSKTLKPDGDTIHLFDPLLLVNNQVIQPKEGMFFVWVTGALKPKIIEVKSSLGRNYVTVRLEGIDAPEEHYRATPFKVKTKGKVFAYELNPKVTHEDRSQPLWKPATDHLVNTLQAAGHALVLLDREAVDIHGRALGYVYASNAFGEKRDFISLDLVKRGLAFPFMFESGGDLIPQFLDAAKTAKATNLGIWKNYSHKALAVTSSYAAPKHWSDEEPAAQQKGKLNLPCVFRRIVDSHQLVGLKREVALRKYDAMNFRTGDVLPGDQYDEIPVEDLIWAPHSFT